MNTAELEALDIAEVIDARGAACPGPLLEAKKAIGKISVGEVVDLWSSDPVTKSDVSVWATKVGHEFLGVLESDGYERVLVRRGK
jgi:tRNA 2-thiouridine synthesizing protein A